MFSTGDFLLSPKAQGSFELLLLVAFIVALSLILATYFLQENDRTRIEALAKSIVLEELNGENNFYFINWVEYSVDSAGSKKIDVCLKPVPSDDAEKAFVAGRIKSAFANNAFGILPENISVNFTNHQAC